MKSSSLLIGMLLLISPLSSSSSKFPIDLLVSQHRKYFPHEVSTFTQHVNIEIKTGENTEKQTQPVQELFLILDTSGSMEESNKLTLHLIQYNSYSSIVFEDENNRELMLYKLRSLDASGGTNLMSGFDQAKDLLKKYSKRTSITDHHQLLAEVTSMKKTFEITICSFGIGLDFDEKLMTNIADYGSGDFFFIRGADSMNKVVDIAYKGFQALIGTNAYLKIMTKNDAHIVETYGYENIKQDENQIIPIGDIRYNDKMNILLETEIKITETFLEKSQIDYMIVELWMTDINNQISKLISAQSVVFSLSRNEEELKDLNKLVEYMIQLQNIQKREKEVTKLLKEQHTQEALEVQINLANEVQILLGYSAGFKPFDAAEEETINYIRNRSNTMNRRSQTMKSLFATDGITDEELALQNEYYSKLNSKYKTSHDDL